ncbi:MAG: hypothetical protein N4A45_11765 [Flavobacteriales bacterium]|jgi:hypothetical protein|nr:hypothetical protein [Flavobacteriales bacterium]
MKEEILNWLFFIEKNDGVPPASVLAFNLGLFKNDEDNFTLYLVGAFEYSEDNDDWACLEPPTKSYRYLELPKNIQNASPKTILNLCKGVFVEMEQEGVFNKTLLKNAQAITTGFNDGELIKIR